MVWRVSVEGGVFDTPERKAALVLRLNERLRDIASTDVRRFYLEAMAAKLFARIGLSMGRRFTDSAASGTRNRSSKKERNG